MEIGLRSVDHVLTRTRSVRRRLDLTRAVPEVVIKCRCAIRVTASQRSARTSAAATSWSSAALRSRPTAHARIPSPRRAETPPFAPQATFAVAEGTGHNIHEEQPGWFAA